MATLSHPRRDPNTLSNYDCWVSTHVTANLAILFDQKKLAGSVVHKLRSKTDSGSTEIILDTNNVKVAGVQIDGKPSSNWELLAPLAPYGSALKVVLDHGVNRNEIVTLEVCYPPQLTAPSSDKQIQLDCSRDN